MGLVGVPLVICAEGIRNEAQTRSREDKLPKGKKTVFEPRMAAYSVILDGVKTPWALSSVWFW